MTQKFIVNGVAYDSPEAMPPDVRAQYDRAMEQLKNVKQTPSKRTVEHVPGGVKINVEKRQVLYNVDGKTYDDPAQLPPEIRAKVDAAMAGARSEAPPQQVNVIEAHVKIRQSSSGGRLLVWILIAAAIIVLAQIL